jgi:hypothetical protein
MLYKPYKSNYTWSMLYKPYKSNYTWSMLYKPYKSNYTWSMLYKPYKSNSLIMLFNKNIFQNIKCELKIDYLQWTKCHGNVI